MAEQSNSKHDGVFKPGAIGLLLLTVTDFDGNPINPSSITVEITRDFNGIAVLNEEPERVRDGYYVYEWVISSTQQTGEYTVTWTYVTDDGTSTNVQSVVVAAESPNNEIFTEGILDLIRVTEGYIMCAQHVPVYYEQAMPTEDYLKYRFTFGKWNQTPKMKIYRNKQLLINGYEIDYFNGTIEFSDMLSDYDHVCADYNFRWFTEEEIYNFLQNALRQLNVAPPFRSWTLRDLTFNSQASQYAAGVIYGAARDALRTMMMCLQFQEPQEVFGGADAAKDAFGNMNTLKENYEKSFDQIIENKKYGKYPRTRTMTVPSYTLPGGRSRWFRYLFSGST